MSFRLVPKSVTLNGVMAVTLRYFSEVSKHALQKTMCGGIYARVYCIFSACTMSSQRKFMFAISSPDEFLVILPKIFTALKKVNRIIWTRQQQNKKQEHITYTTAKL